MTTKINASTSGLTETVDTSGVLEFQTANTSALIIDANQNANFTSTGAITVPVGTTAQRPTTVNGMMRYNTTLSNFEIYANNAWAALSLVLPPVNTVAPVVSGSTTVGGNATVTTGTWTNSPTGYYYQWYANSTAISANATSNVYTITLSEEGANLSCNVTAYNAAGNSSPAASNSVGPITNTYTLEMMIIGGGGSGGSGAPGNSDNQAGGGGGAGGLVYVASVTVFPSGANSFTVTIGGGASGVSPGQGGVGTGSSVTGQTTAAGGGGGGFYNANGQNGGCGGGAAGGDNYVGGTGSQGYNGGNSPATGSGTRGGGGGGGMAGAGGSGYAGTGGAAITTYSTWATATSSGVSGAYAGGGGGNSWADTGRSSGAGGGGGATGGGGNGTSGSATANTGSGSGGASTGSGSGGSGIVIIRYTGSQKGTGGTVYTSGGYTYHKFTSSGTYTS